MKIAYLSMFSQRRECASCHSQHSGTECVVKGSFVKCEHQAIGEKEYSSASSAQNYGDSDDVRSWFPERHTELDREAVKFRKSIHGASLWWKM